MEIKPFKNLFFLCATKGCRHKASKRIYLKTSKDKFAKIYVCENCKSDITNSSVLPSHSF